MNEEIAKTQSRNHPPELIAADAITKTGSDIDLALLFGAFSENTFLPKRKKSQVN